MNSKIFDAISEVGPAPEDMERLVAAELRQHLSDVNALLEVAGKLGLVVEINTFDVQTMNALPSTTQIRHRVLKIKQVA